MRKSARAEAKAGDSDKAKAAKKDRGLRVAFLQRPFLV